MSKETSLQRIIVGQALADRPAAGTGEAQWPSTQFHPTDATQPYVVVYTAPGVLGWVPYNPSGGGGGVTVASGGAPISVTGGPAYVVSFAVPGETNGDLLVRSAGNWTRLGVGSNGQVLSVVGGVPTWAAAPSSVTVASGDGTQVSGGPAYVVNVFAAGQSNGDLLVRSGGAWTRLAGGTNGFVLTMVAGAPQWAASGGGSTFTSGDGIVVTGGPAYVVSQGYAGQVSGDLSYFDGTNWVRFPVVGTDGGVPTADTLGPDRIVVYRQFSGSGGVEYTYAGGHTFKLGFAGQVAGTLAAAIGPPGIDWGPIFPGVENSRLTMNAGFPTWIPNGTEINTVLFLAGVSGNDANDGLTPLTPVKTISRICQLLPEVATGYVIVSTAPEQVIDQSGALWALPQGKGGPGPKGVLFDAPLATVQAAEPCTGAFQGSATVFGTVNPTTPLIAGAFNGLIFTWTTGVMAGRSFRIAENDLVSITICGAFPLPPSLGDLFVIEAEGAGLVLPAPAPGEISLMTGFAVCFSGFTIDLNQNVFISYINLALNCSSFRTATGGLLGLVKSGQLFAANDIVFPTPSFGFRPDCGPELQHDVIGLSGSTIQLEGFRSQNAVIVQESANATVRNAFFVGGNAGLQCTSATMTAEFVQALQVTSTAALWVNAGGVCRCDGFVANMPGGGPAILCENNSIFLGTNLLGSGGTFGLECRTSSRCQVPDANVSSSISGPSGDCQVGGNAGAATWAQIQGNLAADVLDLGAALPQLCAVQI